MASRSSWTTRVATRWSSSSRRTQGRECRTSWHPRATVGGWCHHRPGVAHQRAGDTHAHRPGPRALARRLVVAAGAAPARGRRAPHPPAHAAGARVGRRRPVGGHARRPGRGGGGRDRRRGRPGAAGRPLGRLRHRARGGRRPPRPGGPGGVRRRLPDRCRAGGGQRVRDRGRRPPDAGPVGVRRGRPARPRRGGSRRLPVAGDPVAGPAEHRRPAARRRSALRRAGHRGGDRVHERRPAGVDRLR